MDNLGFNMLVAAAILDEKKVVFRQKEEMLELLKDMDSTLAHTVVNGIISMAAVPFEGKAINLFFLLGFFEQKRVIHAYVANEISTHTFTYGSEEAGLQSSVSGFEIDGKYYEVVITNESAYVISNEERIECGYYIDEDWDNLLDDSQLDEHQLLAKKTLQQTAKLLHKKHYNPWVTHQNNNDSLPPLVSHDSIDFLPLLTNPTNA